RRREAACRARIGHGPRLGSSVLSLLLRRCGCEPEDRPPRAPTSPCGKAAVADDEMYGPRGRDRVSIFDTVGSAPLRPEPRCRPGGDDGVRTAHAAGPVEAERRPFPVRRPATHECVGTGTG